MVREGQTHDAQTSFRKFLRKMLVAQALLVPADPASQTLLTPRV